MIPSDKLAWASGILEGEGCFSIHHRKHKSGNIHPSFAIHCEMTDEDVIIYLQDIFKVGTICHRSNDNRKDNCVRKVSWIWSVQKQKDILEVLILIKPWMFERRTNKIEEMIKLLEVICKK